MTLISLRKQQPEPDEQAVDEPQELEDETGSAEDAGPTRPPGLVRGFAIGVRAWWAWTSSRLGPRGAYTVHAVAIWAAAYYGGWAAVSVALALIVGPSLFIPAEVIDQAVARLTSPGRAPEESNVDVPAEASSDPLVAVLWTLIDDASGVHLKTLIRTLAEAAEKEGHAPPTKEDVEAALTARDIPLRPSVRDTRRKVNRGVHREDLQARQNTPSPAGTRAPDPGP